MSPVSGSVQRAIVIYFLALLGLAAIVAIAVRNYMGPLVRPAPSSAALLTPSGWTETEWPFLNDQFGKGRAFDCKASDCGVDMRVTFRAKIGFCNCATGVSDDEELERIGDVEMLGRTFAPTAEGRVIKVGKMAGRSRPYASGRDVGKAQMLSLAFNDRCDVIVATAQSPNAPPLNIEPNVLKFLNSDFVLHWAEVTLGL